MLAYCSPYVSVEYTTVSHLWKIVVIAHGPQAPLSEVRPWGVFDRKPRPARLYTARTFTGRMARRRHHGMRTMPGLAGGTPLF